MYSDYEDKEFDVIIIGSGISGLTTALYIYEREPTLSILVLEAKNRIGGRIVSQSAIIGNNQNSMFDMGGQFFLHSQKPFINLLEKLDLTYIKSETPKGKILGIFENGTLTTTARPAEFGNVTERIELINFFGQLETLSASVCLSNAYSMVESEELDNITMEQYIHANLKSRRNKSFVNTLLKIIFGVYTSEISVLYYVAYCNSTDGVNSQFFNSPNDEICWVDGGAHQICQRIADIIGIDNIITGDPVYSVTRKSNSILINTQNEVYKYAVVAIPPHDILTIDFLPSLSPKKNAYLKKLSHGKVVKFIIIYDEAFWRNSNLSGDIYFNYASTPILACFHMPSKSNAVLCGYINIHFDTKKRSSWKTLVLQELAKYLGKKTLEPLVYMEKQWNNEHPIGCPFSCPGLNTLKDFLEIRRPIGRLYWAGSETSTYWNGHLAGAVHSGYVAAIEVLYELRPQTLTTADITALSPPRNFISRYNNTLKYKVMKKRNKWVYLIPLGVLTILFIMYTHKKMK